MSDDEVTLGMAVPFDSDGFLRRQCPTCEREFKWVPNQPGAEDEDEPAPDAGYFCPYCGIQAPSNSWSTQAHLELAQNIVSREVVGPLLKDFAHNIEGIGSASGGLISVSAEYDVPDVMDPLTEVDDMTRVDFECHRAEPVKVLEDYQGRVCCLMCGGFAT